MFCQKEGRSAADAEISLLPECGLNICCLETLDRCSSGLGVFDKIGWVRLSNDLTYDLQKVPKVASLLSVLLDFLAIFVRKVKSSASNVWVHFALFLNGVRTPLRVVFRRKRRLHLNAKCELRTFRAQI